MRARQFGRWRLLQIWHISICLAVFAAFPAQAHNVGDSYLYLQIYEDSIDGRFEIALTDLNPALGFSGTDLEITPENVDERIGFLRQYYLDHVTISDDRGPLAIEFEEHELLRARGSHYVLLPFRLPGLKSVPEQLTFDYSVLFDEEPEHRGFLLVEHNWATGTFANENRVSLAFSPTSRRQTFDLKSSGRLRGFLALARLGAEHMLAGLDHLLFLVALLLPAVLRRGKDGWQPVERLAEALGNVARIVTAFVAAHAVALTLAALGLLRLPEALVESAIAASILLAAVHILWPLFRARVWWILFALSLFHGLGFAGALLDLGVVEEHLGLSLLAFNLGVEVGHLIIVIVVVPILLLIRHVRLYRALVLPAAAVALILLSGIWVVERAFGVDIPLRELLPPWLQRLIP